MKSREITYKPEIEQIIRNCQVCHIGMSDENGEPYVLPFNFGYDSDVFYFHSAPQGKKIDILRKSPRVCIALSNAYELRWQSEQVACSYSMKYKSVLAYGYVEFVEDFDEKIQCMNKIMQHYVKKDFDYNKPAIDNVLVYRVKVEKIECRVYGY